MCAASPPAVPRPTRPPPAWDLLAPPLLPVSAMPRCNRVFCFSFGQGPVGTPGATNRALAAFVKGALCLARDDTGESHAEHHTQKGNALVLAQWEIAMELDRCGTCVACSADFLPGEQYITSRQVLEAFAQHSSPEHAGVVAIVAHPDHAWRCWALTTMMGYKTIVLDITTLPDFTWEEHSCDAHGFDAECVQPHTRSRAAFQEYETRMQQDVLRGCPDLQRITLMCAKQPFAVFARENL